MNNKSKQLICMGSIFLICLYGVTGAIDNSLGVPVVTHFIAMMVAFTFCLLLGWVFNKNNGGGFSEISESSSHKIYIAIMLTALMVRITVAYITDGAEADMSCFVGWSQIAAENSLATFYTAGHFADYPPGYIYVLALIGKAVNFLGIDPYGNFGKLLLAIPAITCDLILVHLAYNLGRKRGNFFGLGGALLVAFSPILLMDSVVWKQVDSVLIVLTILCFLALEKERFVASTVFYSLGVLMKPQILVVGPVFALGFLIPLLTKREGVYKAIKRLCGCGILSLCIIFTLSMPFKGSQSMLWLPMQYLGTVSFYSYASVNAANLFSMLGGNYVSSVEGFILTYAQWGWIFLLISTVALLWLFKKQIESGKIDLFLLGGFYLASAFCLMQSVHERYFMAAIFMLIFSFLKSGNLRLLSIFQMQSMVVLGNIILIYLYMNDSVRYSPLVFGSPLRILGGVQVLLIIILWWECFANCQGQNKKENQ